jgi:hypothetical protein
MRHIAELRRAVLAVEVDLDRHERDARYLADLVAQAAEQQLAAAAEQLGDVAAEQQLAEYQQRQASRLAAATQARDSASAASAAARGELEAAIAAQPAIWAEPAPIADPAGHWYLLARTTWVLLTRLLEAGRPAEVPAVATELVLAYRRAAAAQGADRGKIARDLGDLANTAANAHLYDVAVEFDRAGIDVWRSSMADDSPLQTYWFYYARAWYYLLDHLTLAGHQDELTAAAPDALSIYRQAASVPGIDVTRLGMDLTDIANWASGLRLYDVAVTFDKAAIDVLQGHAPQ